MKNPNSLGARLRTVLRKRWFEADFPGGQPHLQPVPVAKDIALFILFPIVCVLLANGAANPRRSGRAASKRLPTATGGQEQKGISSQVINFERNEPKGAGISNRVAPGTLVRVRLLNRAESRSEIPIQAQILDQSLGREFLGGVLLGNGAADSVHLKMDVTFHLARPAGSVSRTSNVAARALSLDGSLGIAAQKAENIFARGVLGGAQDAVGGIKTGDKAGGGVQAVLLQALIKGLSGEMAEDLRGLRSQASFINVNPGEEFFAELTDYFPSGNR